jgi:hypothetical protein
MQHTIETPKQYQCRHIFTDGHRCASPCLRQEEFCYYHHTTRKPITNPQQRRSRRSTFHLPLPEDRSAIQASIGEVLQRIAANDIDPRRAGLLLYGLQIASLNLPKIQPTKTTASQAESQTASQTVEEIITDPELGILAPRTEVSAIETHKSPVLQLIERMLQDEQEEEEAATPEPATIPTLQATADASPVRLPHNHTITQSKRRRHPGRRFSLDNHHRRRHPDRRFFLDTRQRRRHPDRTPSGVEGGVEGPPHFAFAVVCPLPLNRPAGGYSWLLYPMPASTPRI